MVEFLLASGIGVSLFVFAYLLKQDGIKQISRRIAMGIQVVWILRLILFYLKPEMQPVYNAYYIMFDQALCFLDGLFVWLYVRTLLRPDKSFRGIWVHFIPFLLIFSYSTFAVLFRSEQVVRQYNEGIELLKSSQSSLDTNETILVIIVVGINLFYLFRSVKITNSYNEKLQENLSNIDHLTVNWVKTFQNLWITLFIIPLTIYFFNDLYQFTTQLRLGYLMVFTFLTLSIVFNYFLLDQVYKPVWLFKDGQVEASEQNRAEHKKQFEQLEKLLGENRYYLDDELSLSQLADYMEIKSSELTEVIKSSSYENFYDLINSYRIEAVKKELGNSKEQIIQLAYQNGFRSKSTFNKIFKEKTGMTPKDYRVSLRNKA